MPTTSALVAQAAVEHRPEIFALLVIAVENAALPLDERLSAARSILASDRRRRPGHDLRALPGAPRNATDAELARHAANLALDLIEELESR